MVRSWEERRCRLEEIVFSGPTVQLSPVWSDGRQLYDTVCSLGLETTVTLARRPEKASPARFAAQPVT